VPSGSISPSVITGANAVVGQVLKWNGTAWVPAPDYVGVGAHQFAGFTPQYTGNLGGIPGAQAKCAAAFPGSHWARYNEILSLGASYPYGQNVWVLDETPYGAQAANQEQEPTDCANWTSSTSPNTAMVMDYRGLTTTSNCSTQLPLACIF